MKRAVKYTLMISGIISMCICCLFSSPVYADELTYVDMSYTKQTYSNLIQYDMEYYTTGYNGTYSGTSEDQVNISNSANDWLTAYIREGRLGEDSIDQDYPVYIGVSHNLHHDSLSFPMNSVCINIEQATNSIASGIANVNHMYSLLARLLQWQDGHTPIDDMILLTFEWRTLYSMGYLIDNIGSFTATDGTTAYMYIMHHYKGDDKITFTGSFSIDGSESGNQSGTIGNQIDEAHVYMNFDRYDFAPTYITLHGTNDPYRMRSNDYAQIMIQEPNNYNIYDTNCSITAVSGSNPVTYYLNFDSSVKNPYIIFANVNTTAMTTNRIVNTISFNMLTVDGEMDDYSSMLTSINDNIVTIQDLLSDLQVTEINNIYQDITNEYDVDINLTINSILDDLTLHIQDFDLTDPDYQIPQSRIEKISTFRIIYSNILNTMKTSGIGVLYFLPFILIIIGALI